MFAVIKTGGKQYRVAPEDVIRIDRIDGEPGKVVEFGEVLVVGGETPAIGAPTVSGASVAGELIAHERGDKVIAFKKRRRKNSRRKRGFREEFTLIRITEILTDGKKANKTASPRPKRAPAPAAEAGAEAQETAAAAEGATAKKAKKAPKAKAKAPAARAKPKNKPKGKPKK